MDETTSSARPRLDAIDQLRGLVMVIMALDHVRDYFHQYARVDPTDLSLATTTTALFFTRWVTHFCAPTFVFLAGTGAFLYGSRGKTKAEQCRFLISRGFWLVVLELTVVQFGWNFNFDNEFLVGAVIWAIGWSMVGLGALVFLPVWLVTLIGLTIIFGHNAFDILKPDAFGTWDWLWMTLKSGGEMPLTSKITFVAGYPILPWLGVMAAGYGFGTIWLSPPHERRRWLLAIGSAAVLLFIVLRSINVYGDPKPWMEQDTPWRTFLSFLNCWKYPPSLLYLLMTLGPSILLLAWFDRRPPTMFTKPLVVFGRVPLFYYLLHLPLIHGLAVILGYAEGWTGSEIKPFFHHFSLFPKEWGYGLPIVYLVWIIVVVLLYPPCKWFADVKRRRSDWWLSYL